MRSRGEIKKDAKYLVPGATREHRSTKSFLEKDYLRRIFHNFFFQPASRSVKQSMTLLAVEARKPNLPMKYFRRKPQEGRFLS